MNIYHPYSPVIENLTQIILIKLRITFFSLNKEYSPETKMYKRLFQNHRLVDSLLISIFNFFLLSCKVFSFDLFNRKAVPIESTGGAVTLWWD